MKTWAMFSQGPSTITCKFEKNAYFPHEVAKVTGIVDNSKCGMEVDNVSFRLVRKIKAKKRGRFGPKFS
jgi:hypothetical protein